MSASKEKTITLNGKARDYYFKIAYLLGTDEKPATSTEVFSHILEINSEFEDYFGKSVEQYLKQNLKLHPPKLITVRNSSQLREGATIIITGNQYVKEPFKIQEIKKTDHDGIEIIIDKKENRYFNMGLYFSGRSWVRDLWVII